MQAEPLSTFQALAFQYPTFCPTIVVMPQCQGRECGTKVQPAPGAAFRYTEAQCKRACAEGSDLCGKCTAHEEKNMAGMPIGKSGWHGRMGGPYHKNSHIVGTPWNVKKTQEEAAAAAKMVAKVASNAAASGAPVAKAAAKVAVKASKEAVAAAKAAAKFERELDAALLKQSREMQRAETAAARASAAARKTKKAKSSSSYPTSSSSVRTSSRRSSSQIYYPASRAASGSRSRSVRSNRATPIRSSNKERKPAVMNRIVAGHFPELE
jgi:hypothetical protein